MSNIIPLTFHELMKWVKEKKSCKDPLSNREWNELEGMWDLKLDSKQREEILEAIHYKINPKD